MRNASASSQARCDSRTSPPSWTAMSRAHCADASWIGAMRDTCTNMAPLRRVRTEKNRVGGPQPVRGRYLDSLASGDRRRSGYRHINSGRDRNASGSAGGGLAGSGPCLPDDGEASRFLALGWHADVGQVDHPAVRADTGACTGMAGRCTSSHRLRLAATEAYPAFARAEATVAVPGADHVSANNGRRPRRRVTAQDHHNLLPATAESVTMRHRMSQIIAAPSGRSNDALHSPADGRPRRRHAVGPHGCDNEVHPPGDVSQPPPTPSRNGHVLGQIDPEHPRTAAEIDEDAHPRPSPTATPPAPSGRPAPRPRHDDAPARSSRPQLPGHDNAHSAHRHRSLATVSGRETLRVTESAKTTRPRHCTDLGEPTRPVTADAGPSTLDGHRRLHG